MFVRWQWWGDRKRTVERGYRRGKVASAYAVLVESKRVNGQPRHRHVASAPSTATSASRTRTTEPGGGQG
jgi:hypothetical protein